MSLRAKKRSKAKLRSKKSLSAGGSSARLLEQPMTDVAGAVPCELCGHPVDPKRLHFHMVRCHGAVFRR